MRRAGTLPTAVVERLPAEKLTKSGWRDSVGYLPPLIDRLAFDLCSEGRPAANAVAEAVRTLELAARSGQTQAGAKLGFGTRATVQDALDEWEFVVASATLRPLREGEYPLVRLLEADVPSKAYPDLPNKPGKKNWVEKAGGLPSYIERVAKHLFYEKGYDESRSIATAVNWVKKVCATGRTFGGKVKVGEKARAQACAAVASWERKRGSAKVKEGLAQAVVRLKPVVAPIADQRAFAVRYAHRVSVCEGLIRPVGASSALAIGTAIDLLEGRPRTTNRAWDPSPARFTDEEFERACLVDRGPDAGAAKDRFALPVREPDGAVNEHALAEAAGRVSKLPVEERAGAAARLAWLRAASGMEARPPETRRLAEGALYDIETRLVEGLVAERDLCMTLMEALGYAATPIRAREGKRGAFHGMHGTERAVRRRDLIVGDGAVKCEKCGTLRATADTDCAKCGTRAVTESLLVEAPVASGSASPMFEQLHPRVPTGQFGSKGGAKPAGQAAQQDGGQQAGPKAGPKAGPNTGPTSPEQARALVKALQANDPQFDDSGSHTPATTAAGLKAQTAASIAFGEHGAAGDQLQSLGFSDDSAGIARFQKAYGLKVTGKIDDATAQTIANAYSHNARSAASRMPDFTGIAGGGARVRSSATRGRSSGTTTTGSKSRGAPPGRTTIGRTSPTRVREGLLQEQAITVPPGDLYGPMARVKPYPPTGTNWANGAPELARQPDGDDIDFDELPKVPPNLRPFEGVHACASCCHWSRKVSGCMLYSATTLANEVCDDWLTLTPEDANLVLVMAALTEAEESGASTHEIVGLRAEARAAREAAAAVDRPPHPADTGLAEALGTRFDPARHPRGRGGRWAHALGRYKANPSAETAHALGHAYTFEKAGSAMGSSAVMYREVHEDHHASFMRGLGAGQRDAAASAKHGGLHNPESEYLPGAFPGRSHEHQERLARAAASVDLDKSHADYTARLASVEKELAGNPSPTRRRQLERGRQQLKDGLARIEKNRKAADPPGSRAGLEGPFRYRSGWEGYYSPKEGRYYDHKTDTFMPRDFDPETGAHAHEEKKSRPHPEQEAAGLVIDAVSAMPGPEKGKKVEAAVAHMQKRYAQLDNAHRYARPGQATHITRPALDQVRDSLRDHVLGLSQAEIEKSGLKDRAAWMRNERKRVEKEGSTKKRRTREAIDDAAVEVLLDELLALDEFDAGSEDFDGAYWLVEADLSAEGRRKMAKKGHALPDGSYPIPDVAHLKKAIKAFGRAGSKSRVKAWIIRRAKALGATNLLPDDWNVGTQEALMEALIDEVVDVQERLAESAA